MFYAVAAAEEKSNYAEENMKGKQKSRTPTPSRDTRKRRNSHDHEGVELGGGYVRPTRMCDVPVMNIVAAIGGDDALNADLLESFKDAVSVESILETLGSFFAFVFERPGGRVPGEVLCVVARSRARLRPALETMPKRRSHPLPYPSQGMYNFASEFDIIRDPGIEDEHEDRGK